MWRLRTSGGHDADHDTFIAAKAERWVRDGWKGWTGFQSWMLYSGCTDYEPIRDDEVEHAKHDIAAWYAKPIEPFHYCAPQYLSAGTSIAPIEWISRRVPLASMPIGMFRIFGASTVPIVISFVVFGLPHRGGDGLDTPVATIGCDLRRRFSSGLRLDALSACCTQVCDGGVPIDGHQQV